LALTPRSCRAVRASTRRATFRAVKNGAEIRYSGPTSPWTGRPRRSSNPIWDHGHLAALSPKERVAMKKDTRSNVAPVALLILLALVMLVAVHRAFRADEVEKAAIKAGDKIVRDSHSTAAFVVIVTLFGYVLWTALRANQGEGKSMPPTQESSASDKSAPG